MKALYDNLKAYGRPLFQTLHQIRSSKTATNSIQKVLARKHANPIALTSVTPIDGGKKYRLNGPGLYGNKGDVIRFPDNDSIELDVVDIDWDSGDMIVRHVMEDRPDVFTPEVGMEAILLYYATPEIDSLTNAVKVALENATIRFLRDGVDTEVSKTTATPLTAIGLPVEEVLKSVKNYHRKDYAALTVTDAAEEVLFTTAAIIKKIIISDTAGMPLLFKVDGTTAFIVPAGGIEIEHYIPSGSDIGIQSVSGNISEGDLILNLVG